MSIQNNSSIAQSSVTTSEAKIDSKLKIARKARKQRKAIDENSENDHHRAHALLNNGR